MKLRILFLRAIRFFKRILLLDGRIAQVQQLGERIAEKNISLNRSLAVTGERRAANYLRQKGYQILNRNWSVPEGELDIVCRYRNTLVAVEVKTRKAPGSNMQDALDAVTTDKVKRIKKLLAHYSYNNSRRLKAMRIKHTRIDVIGIIHRTLPSPLKKHSWQLTHLEDIDSL
ncbi:MAG: DUF91 domain-containing protein [Candidatus Dadabacteria bacterium]|nr:MAG: DUF91 domain-containing protein [Candidatus Dadabacteria bacterium]